MVGWVEELVDAAERHISVMQVRSPAPAVAELQAAAQTHY